MLSNHIDFITKQKLTFFCDVYDNFKHKGYQPSYVIGVHSYFILNSYLDTKVLYIPYRIKNRKEYRVEIK